MITVFKQPIVEQKTAQWYQNRVFFHRPQIYPGIRQGRQWMDMKTLARQAYALQTASNIAKTTKKDVFTSVLSNSK